MEEKKNSPCRMSGDFLGHFPRRPVNFGSVSIDTAHASVAAGL
jgi:hypothetical protein